MKKFVLLLVMQVVVFSVACSQSNNVLTIECYSDGQPAEESFMFNLTKASIPGTWDGHVVTLTLEQANALEGTAFNSIEEIVNWFETAGMGLYTKIDNNTLRLELLF